MLPGFLLALREGLEVALIIGIVIGVLRRLKRKEFTTVVWLGASGALFASLVMGVCLYLLGIAFTGRLEALFEAFTMLLAAGVLTWMIYWMQRQSRTIKAELEQGVTGAIATTGRWGLFFLAFTTVVREGLEFALLLVAAGMSSALRSTLSGALLGLLLAITLGWLLFRSTLRLNLRLFFLGTGILLILFSAGLVGQAIHELNDLGWVPPIIQPVWDANPLISESSFLGQTLKTLFGFDANPSLSQVIGYLGYFLLVWLGVLWNRRKVAVLQEA